MAKQKPKEIAKAQASATKYFTPKDRQQPNGFSAVQSSAVQTNLATTQKPSNPITPATTAKNKKKKPRKKDLNTSIMSVDSSNNLSAISTIHDDSSGGSPNVSKMSFDHDNEVDDMMFQFVNRTNNEDRLSEEDSDKMFHKTDQMLERLLKHPIFESATDDTFVHALCMITGIAINFNMIDKQWLLQMHREIVAVMSHEKMNIQQLQQWPHGKKAAQMLSTCNKNATVTQMIRSIREGNNKGITRITDWSLFTKAIGIFLPKQSLPDGYRKTLLSLAFKELCSTTFTHTKVDCFSYAVLAHYTGMEQAYQSRLPGFILDRGIPIQKRCDLADSLKISILTNPTKGFIFGTKEWCSAETYCKIDFCNALNYCSTCTRAIHADCGTFRFNHDVLEVRCPLCLPTTRHILLPLGKPFHIPLPHITTAPATSRLNTTQATIDLAVPNTNNNSITSAITNSDTHGAANNSTKTEGRNSKHLNTSDDRHDLKSRQIGFSGQDSIKEFQRTKVKTTITTRCTLKIQMPTVKDDEDETEVLKNILIAVLLRLSKVDKTIQCIPWSSSEKGTSPNLVHDNMPNSLEGIHEFMPRIEPNPGQPIYTDIRFTHEQPWETISKEISMWLKFRKYWLFPKRLQVERTTNIGWLLWSHEAFCPQSLVNAMRAMQLDVDIKWAIIRVERNEDLGEHPVRALLIIAPIDEADETRDQLFQIYNKSFNYPLSISMKFMPMTTTPSRRAIKQTKRARAKQGVFLTTIDTYTVNYINDMSYRPPIIAPNPALPNIRTVIMSHKTRKSNHNMFLSISESTWAPNLHTFVFYKRYAKEAREFIRTLPGYLFYLFKIKATGYLTAEAALSGSKMHYDKKSGTMITEEDRKMNDVMRLVNKREKAEYKKHAEARLLGELSDEEDTRLQAAAASFMGFDDDTISEEAQSEASYENSVQRQVVNVFTGESPDDMGTYTSRTTRVSEREGYVGDCDRSTIQSSVGKQLDINDINLNSTVAEHTNLIANIEVLKELERELRANQRELNATNNRHLELARQHKESKNSNTTNVTANEKETIVENEPNSSSTAEDYATKMDLEREKEDVTAIADIASADSHSKMVVILTTDENGSNQNTNKADHIVRETYTTASTLESQKSQSQNIGRESHQEQDAHKKLHTITIDDTVNHFTAGSTDVPSDGSSDGL